MNHNHYVLITAARNEEEYIERTIRSVVSQSKMPKKWIIVSDGSTDGTDEIIERYARINKFIELIKTPGDSARNFGSKAKAVNFGYEKVRNVEFDFIGNLDADVSFDTNYYQNVLNKFIQDSKLGIAGGIRYDLINGKFEKVICSRNSVGGPFQLFRRKCYEAIGGYTVLKYGGIDAVAEIMARMKGWKVESFPEIKVYHYRTTSSATGNAMNFRFRDGIKAYIIGYHPLFLILRALKTIHYRPIVLGSFIWIAGYVWAAISKHKREVSDDFVQYLRKEQLTRLRLMVLKLSDPNGMK